jgi:hypothetical protein
MVGARRVEASHEQTQNRAVGGGNVDLYCALEVERRLTPQEAEVVLISEESPIQSTRRWLIS